MYREQCAHLKAPDVTTYSPRLFQDVVRRQIWQSMAPGVREAGLKCRVLARLRKLWHVSPRPMGCQPWHLAALFDQLTTDNDAKIERLTGIYRQYLEPLLVHHFNGDERERLKSILKSLVILRSLGIPYRAGCPIPIVDGDRLLASLHRRCGGIGLMTWREVDERRPVYVVEADADRFLGWITGRMTAFVGVADREKATLDAVWSVLFSTPDRGIQLTRELSPGGPQASSAWLHGDAFPAREAVLIRCPDLGAKVLVFESPWVRGNRGLGVDRALGALPPACSARDVWVWHPRRLTSRPREHVTCYLALGRALRRSSPRQSPETTLFDALRDHYLQASVLALQEIVDCYRYGIIETDGGAWKPRGESLLHVVEGLVTWALGRRDRRRRV